MRQPRTEPAQRGFAVIVVLGLLALAALLGLSVLQDAAFGQALAGARQHRQQAFAAAELALQAALQAMASDGDRDNSAGHAPSLPGSRGTYRWRRVAVEPLPAGFSTGMVARHHYEIEATATAPRRASSTQVAGVARLVPRSAEALP